METNLMPGIGTSMGCPPQPRCPVCGGDSDNYPCTCGEKKPCSDLVPNVPVVTSDTPSSTCSSEKDAGVQAAAESPSPVQPSSPTFKPLHVFGGSIPLTKKMLDEMQALEAPLNRQRVSAGLFVDFQLHPNDPMAHKRTEIRIRADWVCALTGEEGKSTKIEVATTGGNQFFWVKEGIDYVEAKIEQAVLFYGMGDNIPRGIMGVSPIQHARQEWAGVYNSELYRKHGIPNGILSASERHNYSAFPDELYGLPVSRKDLGNIYECPNCRQRWVFNNCKVTPIITTAKPDAVMPCGCEPPVKPSNEGIAL